MLYPAIMLQSNLSAHFFGGQKHLSGSLLCLLAYAFLSFGI